MMKNQNIPYYFIGVGLFIIFKFAYTLANTSDLIFLLKPTNTLVSFLTGSDSIYEAESGFYHESLNIIIDKSCSGFNFWLISFVVFTYLSVKYFEPHAHKILSVFCVIIGSYFFTILVNTSRIFSSIVIQNQTINIFPKYQHIIHESIGIVTNLTFLIVAYLLIEKILIHTRPNAKLT